jgi:hypothetical protein
MLVDPNCRGTLKEKRKFLKFRAADCIGPKLRKFAAANLSGLPPHIPAAAPFDLDSLLHQRMAGL